jgi:glutamine cyclotransferase
VKLGLLSLLVMSSAYLAAAPQSKQAVAQSTAPISKYRVVRVYPHDPEAFTQGLVYLDGFLYEGTGLNGRSSIRKVKLENGEVVQIEKLDSQYFGEGIAIKGDTIYELTWQSEIGFLYDRATFARKGTFNYKGEGWGLTYDGQRLIMSDGSAFLRFLDPVTLKELSRIQVKDGTTPVGNLNELEYVKGEVFANVWQTHRIARIAPKTGRVIAWLDLEGLLMSREAQQAESQGGVLNGIAYDAAGDRLFVTGKLWPKLFEIKVE